MSSPVPHGGILERDVEIADWYHPNQPRKMHSLMNFNVLDLEVIRIPLLAILNSFRHYFQHGLRKF